MAKWLKGLDPFGGGNTSGGLDAIGMGLKLGTGIAKTFANARHRREMEEVKRAEGARLEALEAAPPPIHGSAEWTDAATLRARGFLRESSALDHPSSILLGALQPVDSATPQGWLHWDGEGHLVTVAPTRAGKSTTTIVPNLLRYKGSCVVLDPKGELFRDTSAWRSQNVGPVYRIAPFEPKTDAFNPLEAIRLASDARALADLMIPEDPNGQDFFRKDAIAFLNGAIQFVHATAPADYRNLAEVRRLTALPTDEFLQLAAVMSKNSLPAIASAGNVVLGKSKDRGLPVLRDTLNSDLSLWDDPGVIRTTAVPNVDFHALKERPATVYITVPFDKMSAFAPFLRVLLATALGAMVQNTTIPPIPVLFVLDEFLSLGYFPQFREAIRTHAGAGVRLWFFLQNIAMLEEIYQTAWRAFFDASVQSFFGTTDVHTGAFISEMLGDTTIGHRSSSISISASSSHEDFFETSTSEALSVTHAVNLSQRRLLTPSEVVKLLGSPLPDKTRIGILRLNGSADTMVRLIPYFLGQKIVQRVGCLDDRRSTSS